MKYWIVIFIVILIGCASKGPVIDNVYEQKMPDKLLARIELAERYLWDGAARDALKQLLIVRDDALGYARYHFDLAMCYLALDQKQQAIQEFQKALKQNPIYGEAWNNLGVIYLNQRKFELAKKCFEKALSILTYSTPELPALNMARLYLKQGNYDQAQKYVRLSIQKNWRYADAYLFLARLLTQEEKLEQANKVLQQGVEAVPEDPRLILEYAKSLLKLGYSQKAKHWFKELVQNYAKTKEAKVARDYLEFLP
ncbi:MAG: tetratricopeptide repeat protein [Desulfonauticus sp.]|nr:tetratricopeptide repeat protein [Desulfonauticus sp.]